MSSSLDSLPLITIVTPSFNQGDFIEATIQSVLKQKYPHVEYIVMDGGSTDQTKDVIKKYEDHITYWESKPDAGQTNAINKGFKRATGDIWGWLNSDDFLLPGALEHVGDVFARQPDLDVLSGAGISYEQTSDSYQPHRACITGMPPNLLSMLTQHGNVIQHSTFWRSSVMEDIGYLDESYDYAMDHEFFLRCCAGGKRFRTTDTCLAAFRLHDQQKTKEEGSPYIREANRSKSSYIGSSLLTSQSILTLYRKGLGLWKKHRNTHPSIGLAPSCDRPSIDSWLKDIGVRTN